MATFSMSLFYIVAVVMMIVGAIHSTPTSSLPSLLNSAAISTNSILKSTTAIAGKAPLASPPFAFVRAWNKTSTISGFQGTPVPTITWFNSTPLATPQPLQCGEYGDFTLNWDDEPKFDATNGNDFMYPPVFNPYHQLFFSNGYAYAPPPDAPFKPVSPPFMAVFLPNSTNHDVGSPSAAGVAPGELGAGPNAPISAFWFNAYGAYLGCDDGGPDDCLMAVKGYVYDAERATEVLSTTQFITVPPCIGFVNCSLEYYGFTEEHRGLSGLQITASVNGQPRIFFMDNLELGWYNNTCAAGLQRLMIQ